MITLRWRRTEIRVSNSSSQFTAIAGSHNREIVVNTHLIVELRIVGVVE